MFSAASRAINSFEMPPATPRLQDIAARVRARLEHVEAELAHPVGDPLRQHREPLADGSSAHAAIISMPIEAISSEMK